jgi:hypothetical protein
VLTDTHHTITVSSVLVLGALRDAIDECNRVRDGTNKFANVSHRASFRSHASSTRNGGIWPCEVATKEAGAKIRAAHQIPRLFQAFPAPGLRQRSQGPIH